MHDTSPEAAAAVRAAILRRSPAERLQQALELSEQVRELSFYGAEDLTPSGFYGLQDADRAREGARHVVQVVAPVVLR